MEWKIGQRVRRGKEHGEVIAVYESGAAGVHDEKGCVMIRFDSGAVRITATSELEPVR